LEIGFKNTTLVSERKDFFSATEKMNNDIIYIKSQPFCNSWLFDDNLFMENLKII
jgi:hypothetical protein